MHGLATDTDDFSLARSTDFRAASQLADVCDRDLLQDLSRRLIAPSAMDVIARSLSSLFVRRNFAMAGVGFVAESERDTIAQAADFLIRREDIDTVVVYGIVGGVVLGTVLFGDQNLALRRAVSKYHYYFSMENPDPRTREVLYFVKFNN